MSWRSRTRTTRRLLPPCRGTIGNRPGPTRRCLGRTNNWRTCCPAWHRLLASATYFKALAVGSSEVTNGRSAASPTLAMGINATARATLLSSWRRDSSMSCLMRFPSSGYEHDWFCCQRRIAPACASASPSGTPGLRRERPRSVTAMLSGALCNAGLPAGLSDWERTLLQGWRAGIVESA